jgi:hypothetical protein
VPLRKRPKYEIMLPKIIEMTEAGSSIDLISRALGVGKEVVREALRLHRTGKRPPGRGDGRRREPRSPDQPFMPKYQKMAAEVAAREGRKPPRPTYEWSKESRAAKCKPRGA